MGYPGYAGRVPKSAASLAKVLQTNGYTTMALGRARAPHGISPRLCA